MLYEFHVIERISESADRWIIGVIADQQGAIFVSASSIDGSRMRKSIIAAARGMRCLPGRLRQYRRVISLEDSR